jgi:hypothetical protein
MNQSLIDDHDLIEIEEEEKFPPKEKRTKIKFRKFPSKRST